MGCKICEKNVTFQSPLFGRFDDFVKLLDNFCQQNLERLSKKLGSGLQSVEFDVKTLVVVLCLALIFKNLKVKL